MLKYIIINGLVRDENILFNSLKTYNLLISEKIVDKILFVTDIHLKTDGNNIPVGSAINNNVRKKLIENNVEILEIDNLSIEDVEKIDPKIQQRPRNSLRKNTITGLSLWRPMFSLKKALEYIPQNSFVLKTRTDVSISYNLLKKIFTQYIIPNKNTSLLKYKIWSTGFNEKELFYIMDFSFAGYRDDLLKTTHMNGIYLKWGDKSPSGVNNFNTLWWVDIFIKEFPKIKDYIEKYVVNPPVIKQYKEKLYYECIAYYYKKIDEYFIIDSGVNEFMISQSWGQKHIFNSHSEIHKNNFGLIRHEFKNSEWISKLKKNKFKNNIFLININHEFNKINKN
tara:strand:- start:32 stop:1045 length:1014 start_codon:yes stop_codon:yes gene_type:complete